MLTKHCTDEELQLYAINKQHVDKRVAEHIHICEDCRIKVEVYQSLITGIKQQPQPAFDFDLAEIVLTQLPSPTTKTSHDKILIWSIAFVCIALVGTGLYFFRNYFKYLFDGLATILVILIAVSAVTVLTGLYIDMYKKYRKEMSVLDLS